MKIFKKRNLKALKRVSGKAIRAKAAILKAVAHTGKAKKFILLSNVYFPTGGKW